MTSFHHVGFAVGSHALRRAFEVPAVDEPVEPDLTDVDWAALNDEMLETDEYTPEQWAEIDDPDDEVELVVVAPGKTFVWDEESGQLAALSAYNDGLPKNMIMFHDTGWVDAHWPPALSRVSLTFPLDLLPPKSQ